LAHTLAKLAVIAAARIGEYYSFGRPRLGQSAQLLQSDLGFGLESNLRWNSRPSPAFVIREPFFGQIEPIGHRQAGMEGGYGDGHGALAVVVFPQLAPILSGHPYGVLTLLGKSGIIDDPCQNRSLILHLLQSINSNCPHHRVITPRSRETIKLGKSAINFRAGYPILNV
jgi:hypothetical protein